MKFNFNTLCLSLAVLLSFSAQSFAQVEANSPKYVRLAMTDGTYKLGELISMDEDNIRVMTLRLGETNVPKYLVNGMIELDESQYVRLAKSEESRTFDINPQSSRYFFAPSGLQLKKNDGYFQSNVALNSVNMGLSDHLTIGGLISVVGAGGSFKIGTELSETVHISCGGIGFIDYYGELEKPMGLVFANVTWGTDDRNITVNIGTGSSVEDGIKVTNFQIDSVASGWDPDYYYTQYIITDYDQRNIRPLLLNVSGMSQIGENRWFITENYFIRNYQFTTPISGGNLIYSYLPSDNDNNNNNEGLVILSMGIRNLSKRSGWLWDYGIIGVMGDDFGFATPWLSATLAF